MPRKKLIRTTDFPYHITARSNNKEWFYIPMQNLWNIFLKELLILQRTENLIIYQFVLMSNHYHMLIKTPNANIDRVMYLFQKKVSLEINKTTNRVNHVFGGPYKWSLIKDEKYLFNVVKYIFQNPIRAKIVDKCEEYNFSSLRYITEGKGGYKKLFSLDKIVDIKDELFLELINISYSSNEYNYLKKGLKKTEFKLSMADRVVGKALKL